MENRTRTGLVLEGGGMRGIYTAGVLDVFMENGVHFDGVIGVSAGAVHGCSFVSGQKGRNLRYYKKYCRDRRFMSMWNLITTGDIVGEKFCYHELPERLEPFDYETFNASGTEFYVTCTNVENGRAEYLHLTDMKAQIDLIRASASLPYVSRIVCADGKKMLDGGCSDSIPVEAFIRLGFEKNVVILTREKGYEKKPEKNFLTSFMYRKYPAFIKTIEERHSHYNETQKKIDELEKDGKIFVIRPETSLNIARMGHNPDELQRVYDIGVRDGKRQIAAMKRWMEG